MSDFETVPVGTMKRLEQAEAERDEAFAKGKQVFEALRRVEAKLNALAAHVEEVRAAYISGGQWAERVIAIGRVLNQSPTTSFSRLKEQWQAEALEPQAYRLMKEDDDLRRQAEGGE